MDLPPLRGRIVSHNVYTSPRVYRKFLLNTIRANAYHAEWCAGLESGLEQRCDCDRRPLIAALDALTLIVDERNSRPHVLSEDCWCQPTVESVEPS